MAKAKEPAEAPDTKPACPVTRATFKDKAVPVKITINGETKLVPPKEFSTGSFGWFSNEKFVAEVDGVAVKVQANISFVVVGSKEKAK